MTTFVEFRLLDPDLQTVHGILPFQKGDLYLQLNEPGSGSVKTALDIASAALVESGGFIEARYRDAVRGGFFVENLGESDVNSGEEAGRGLEVSGRGALALLEDAVVWTDGTGSNKRVFSGTQAAMLISLIEAAQTRGGLGIVDWDFTATLDSDGVAWTDDFPLELTVGTSLLDVVRQIAKTGIDFEMNPDGSGNYVLSAYKNGVGSNKSGTVYFRVGVNCTEVSHSEAGGGIRNALLVKYKGGYTSVQDATSIAARRRRESALNYDFVQRPDSAGTFANAELQGKKDPKRQISVKVYDGAGPRAFVDYVLGDTITLDVRGDEAEYRIRGIHLSWADNENAEVIVDLNSMILENEIRVTQDLDWLLNEWKTAHDAGLLEVSFWAAIGDPNITYQGRPLAVKGNLLYVSSGSKIYEYDTDKGGWRYYASFFTTITCLEVVGDDVYAAGGDLVYRYTAGVGVQIAVVDLSSDPGYAYVFSLQEHDGALIIGGDFDKVNGNVWTGLASYSPSSGTFIDIGGGTPASHNCLYSDGTFLYAGLGFQAKKWDGATWEDLGGSFSSLAILCIAPFDNTVVAGTAADVYILEGGTWNLLGGGVGGDVWALQPFLADIFVGGDFAGGVKKYSAGTWFDLEEGTNDGVIHLAMIGSNLYVSGVFSQAGDKTALKIAAYISNFDDLANYLENSTGEFNLGEAIHNATAKTSLTGADEMPLWDSISQALRKITWTNIIASIKTWADTIYVALTGNQTIAGIKTFSSFPVTPSSAPTTDYQAANKKYVDDNIGGGGGTPGGSDTEIQYNNGGAFGGDSELTWDDVSKVLAIGDMTLIPLIAERTLRLAGYSVSPSIVMHAFGASYAPHLTFEKADLSAGPTFENVKDDQVIGRIRGKGWDGGAGWTDSRLEIRFVADGDWASGDTPTRIELYICPDGSGTLTLAMTIGSDGNVDIASGKEYRVNGVQHEHASDDLPILDYGEDMFGRQYHIWNYEIDFLQGYSNTVIEHPLRAVGSSLGSWSNTEDLENHPGVIQFLSSSPNGYGYAALRQITSMIFQGGEVFEAIFRFHNANYIYALARFGFLDTPNVASAMVDGVYIQVTGTTIQGKTANNSVQSTTATSYASLAQNVWYRAVVEVSDDKSTVTFRIYSESGTLLWSDTLVTNIPTAAGRAFGVMAVLGGSQTSVYSQLDWMRLYSRKALTR